MAAEEAAERHRAVAQKIRSNFFADGVGLWLNASGHPAAWREEVAYLASAGGDEEALALQLERKHDYPTWDP